MLFGDIGYKAAGSFGRNIVYVIIYSLDATRCVILHLAASQSLRCEGEGQGDGGTLTCCPHAMSADCSKRSELAAGEGC